MYADNKAKINDKTTNTKRAIFNKYIIVRPIAITYYFHVSHNRCRFV